MAAKTPHPDADMLAAFSEQALTPPERESILLHLSACRDCREVVSLSLPEEELMRAAAPGRRWFGMPYRVMQWSTAGLAAAVVLVAVVIAPEFRQKGLSPEELRPGASATTDRTVTIKSGPTTSKDQPPGKEDGELKVNEGSAGKVETEVIGNAAGKGKLDASLSPPPPPPAGEARQGRAFEIPAAQPARKQAPGGSTQVFQISRKDAAEPTVAASDAAKASAGRDAAVGMGSGVGAGVELSMGASAAPAMADQARAERSDDKLKSEMKLAAPAAASVTVETDVQMVESATAEVGPATRKMAKQSSMAPPAANEMIVVAGAEPVRRDCRLRAQSVECRAGGTWRPQTLAGSSKFAKLISNSDTYWAITDDGKLYVSLAGSAQWSELQPPWKGGVKRLIAADALKAEVGTDSGERWHTADGGATWRKF